METINRNLIKSISYLSRKRAEERSKKYILGLVLLTITLHYIKYKDIIDKVIEQWKR